MTVNCSRILYLKGSGVMDKYIVVRTEWDFARKDPGKIALGPYNSLKDANNVVECEVFFGVAREDLVVLRLNKTSRSLCGGCGRNDIPDECPCMDPWT